MRGSLLPWKRRPAPVPDPEEALPAAGPGPLWEGRGTLRDPERQAELERHGFTVVPLLDGDQLERVRRAHASLGPAPDDPRRALNWTFHSRSAEHKRAVKATMLDLMGAQLDTLLADQEIYLTTFMTKWPGPDGGFAPHQDPSLVDERRFTGVTVWIPLEDTGLHDGHDNGMLRVVPGSHRFSRALRVSDVDKFIFADHERAIIDEHGWAVPTAAGEALVFDNRLIHYSMPNRTDRPRVVISFGARPREAACVLVRGGEAGMVDLYELPDDFYIDVLPAEQHRWVPPTPPFAHAATVSESWTEEEFSELCRSQPQAPRAVRIAVPADEGWRNPDAFCALCGSTEGLGNPDRDGRNNAQLVCERCATSLESESPLR